MSDGVIRKITLPNNKTYDLEPSFPSDSKNLVFATPTNTVGEPSFRALDVTDIPSGIARTVSPTFTGTPIAPTPNASSNSQQIATTAFVQAVVNNMTNDIITSDLLGEAEGVAQLDENGKVPSSQLPSYVDDVVEVNNYSSLPSTGETGKIYVDKSTNLIYRWSGSTYIAIGNGGENLALGTTHSTAYYGDYGAAAYAHGVTNKGSAFTEGLYKITTNAEGHVTGAVAVTASDITALGIPAQDTTYSSLSEDEDNNQVSLVTRNEKFIWNNKGTVTSIAAGDGLSGGTITDSGTIKANLLNYTKLSYGGLTGLTQSSDRIYPVALDSNGKLAVNVPWESGEGYPTYIYAGTSSGASNSSVSSGNVYVKMVDNGVVTNSIQLKGSGGTTITSASGVITISSEEIDTSSISDTKVTQTNTTASSARPLLLAYTTGTTESTNTVYKSSYLTYNPSTKALVTNGTINGYTLADACAKSVDTSISSSSTNLPTSAAVAAYACAAPIVRSASVTTSTSYDTLSPNSSIPALSDGQLVFITLTSALSGTKNVRVYVNSVYRYLYIDSSTYLQAPYQANSVLAFVYLSNKLIMINPPVAI